MSRFEILGIHGEKVRTVEGNVARVRMFIGEQEFDEDFPLPELPITIHVTSELYRDLLAPKIQARMLELERSF